MDAVDFTRQSADRGDGDDDGLDRLMRDIQKKVLPFHAMWNDPEQVERFRQGLADAMGGRGLDTTPAENALLRQGREKGQGKLRSENQVPAGADYTPPKAGKNAGARFRGPSADPVFGAVGEGEELERDDSGAMRLSRHRRL
jgi:hypothetical protein